MPQNTHVEIATAEAERLPEHAEEVMPDLSDLRARAAELAKQLAWIPKTESSHSFDRRFAALQKQLTPVFESLEKAKVDAGVRGGFSVVARKHSVSGLGGAGHRGGVSSSSHIAACTGAQRRSDAACGGDCRSVHSKREPRVQ